MISSKVWAPAGRDVRKVVRRRGCLTQRLSAIRKLQSLMKKLSSSSVSASLFCRHTASTLTASAPGYSTDPASYAERKYMLRFCPARLESSTRYHIIA